MQTKIITIDGPAGSGKTTVSKALASRLNCIYVDTGALYRGVAYEVKRSNVQWQDEGELKRFLNAVNLELTREGTQLLLLSSGKDITTRIRTPEISMLASSVSAKPLVRSHLLDIQRNIALHQDAVFEGRDMGTVVFPDADYKFFLFADLGIRALRRHTELKNSDVQALENVKQEMEKRDKNDIERTEAPLKPAEDAHLIDSTHLSIDDVVCLMLEKIR